ncbi:MAG: L-glutamate gamma-semialdehyde dehydrogenase [Ignavibacteriaceae bacterium]|jgi:delta-1-pyrroline-5-carboxylate dehydrogenase (EC 1.5.1.12)|nr:MAG: L-glutamate gamma-semialdehyde dehydrogenase [Chlorobiota bacterium]KXK02325.1 MAG: NAD-dependent aldehyde dehydrogenase [Chlorobi bacterium OLB4]MBV6398819.1 1-pyrroline-5-carboxylate dehydrogenase 2 [Ignavibacteria bacterium]MCC6885009.1 L-glutamate gamma-semialdehyde dehydrogenase [Ignavibacteriales bacterium]MCE7952200.1 L-glutamate gamma-semialdehyde dehydrogenase [Chlorobi bacterium CHB7]MDL1886243.1 L-glutamate gamma-semialdehyde dehydrogenase [Ignavibacteria bacterium CHB1]MEB
MGISKFKNEPFTDFSSKKEKKAFLKSLDKIKSRFNNEYPIRIGKEKIFTETKFASHNPSNSDQIVGVFQKGTADHADKCVKVAHETFGDWSRVSPKKRSDYLLKAAKLMRKRKHDFSAMMVYEVGKNWAEADGDTAEAIDFLEFYAREMLRYAEDQPLTKIKGELNKLTYIPLGTCVIIPPWNFPLAILVGMTTAAIVAGNTVVLKPSSDSPAIAQMFVELMEEVGLPDGVLNFITGGGGTIGDVLVEHPLTRLIAFTGSMEVGLRVNELAAKKQPSQIWIKRVIAEMGGKDSIIIDKDLHNFDDAVAGVLSSAFGFSGQKCSACSRVIVHEKIYDKFCDALAEQVKSINVGETVDNPKMGPVINKKSKDSILSYIQKGVDEGGTIIAGGKEIESKGYFVEPTIIKNVSPKDTIAQEEIFGPVLAVIKSSGFDDSLDIANNTMFGLTGAVYSKNPKKLERAADEFHVGNLYMNRKCTGALVGVHPFGGFNMSGTDSKAGGRDYLQLFTQAKLVSNKIK